jgi:predicted Zn finger-like uncharacterized protein
MKFLCPKCQAKYQIAEEKIAGRSVKMKCRQCGELIHVGELMQQQAAAASPPVVAQRDNPPSPTTAARYPAAAVVPRPQLTAPSPPVRTSQVAPHGSSPRATATAGAASAAGAVGSLKGAFEAAVDGANSIEQEHPLASDEWYVGIGERPIGPIRLSEIRERVMKGEIVEESLVWRDGFEEWRPLASFPELSAVLEEALFSAHPPRRPPPKPTGHRAGVLAAAPTPGAAGPPIGPVEAAAAQVAIPRLRDERPDGVAPATAGTHHRPAQGVESRVAEVRAAAAHDEVPEPTRAGAAEPAAPTAPESRAPLPVVSTKDAREPSPAVVVVAQRDAEPADFSLMGRHRVAHPALPLSAWFAIAAAVVFGIVIGVVLFGNRQTPAEARPAATAAASPAHAPSAEVVTEQIVAVVATADITGDPREEGSRGGGVRRATVSPEPSVVLTEGLKGLSGLRGSGAPQSGPAAVSETPQSAGRPLDSDTLNRTVSRYTPSIRRSCWIPALDSRPANAPSSARVSASITVSPTGRVQAVTTSGDPRGYTGLALCIQSRIRVWEFPASSGATQVNVPFVFAVQ